MKDSWNTVLDSDQRESYSEKDRGDDREEED